MSKYTLANGTLLTDADINELRKEFESESWTGHLERIHYGPAQCGDDPADFSEPLPHSDCSPRVRG
jgi:hypothetical protein